jgi:hypothetical protein
MRSDSLARSKREGRGSALAQLSMAAADELDSLLYGKLIASIKDVDGTEEANFHKLPIHRLSQGRSMMAKFAKMALFTSEVSTSFVRENIQLLLHRIWSKEGSPWLAPMTQAWNQAKSDHIASVACCRASDIYKSLSEQESKLLSLFVAEGGDINTQDR